MENYRELATRTECEYSESLVERAKENVRLLHAVLGLGGEIAELREAIKNDDQLNVLEELGDCYWYLAIIENVLDLSFKFDPKMFLVDANEEDLVDDLEYHICKLIDMMKRTIYYNKSTDDWDCVGEEVALTLGSICYKYETAVYSVKNANIEKLKARHGDKFSEERVLDRDLENETNILRENLQQ